MVDRLSDANDAPTRSILCQQDIARFARPPDDRVDHARQGDQVDPAVHLWGQDPRKVHSFVFSLRRFSPNQPRRIRTIRRGHARIVPGAPRNYAGV
jgi:hypothetical protein